MNKQKLVAYSVVAIVVVAAGVFYAAGTRPACTEEAKMCPDGSAVGRTGPNCEFAACPSGEARTLSEPEARAIAEATCIKGGEALSAGAYNENSKTWWFDANLNASRPGCSPACVVFEETRAAEVNWRCTGLITPN
jgi:hypothetical protein